ncbi:MAG: dihydroorotate dehydrogenase [Thermoplasmata archaeon]|nr:MAG: dihydroorotate dehydrogenase [Thermoplasmata archaeon]
MADIGVEVCGIRLKHPVMLASGILGISAETMKRAEEGGASAVITKSFSIEERAGHENPTIALFKHGILNSMGLPNPGARAMAKEIEKAKKMCRVPIIASVFGKDADEFVKACEIARDSGADAVEINLSCPHVPGTGMELGVDPNAVKEIVTEVKSCIDLPVFVKLTPNTHALQKIALMAVEGGADAIVAINTVRGMLINPMMKKPELSTIFGGYSGPGILPIGIYCVYTIYSAVGQSVPVIGVGGICRGMDAIQYFMAGASAVQVGSAVYYRGYSAFSEIANEIETFLENEGVNSIRDIIGIAVR